MIDLSSPVVQWAALIIALILVFIVVRYFFHIVLHVLRFLLQFFWHGCFTVIAIVILWYILHAFKVI